jgi:hypothetical protein
MTALLEVPGEMFDIAMTKSPDDQGVVGSTSDILKFSTRKVQEAITTTSVTTYIADSAFFCSTIKRLRFVLGTEVGGGFFEYQKRSIYLWTTKHRCQ